MKAKKVLGLLLSVAMAAGLLTGCGNGDSGNSSNGGGSVQSSGQTGNGGNSGSGDSSSGAAGGGEVADTKPFYLTLDPQVSGSIDVMCWSGDSVYHEDIGHQELAPEDLTTQNYAMLYAMAKKFNEMYPNLKMRKRCPASSMLYSSGRKARSGTYPISAIPGTCTRMAPAKSAFTSG